MSSHIRTFTGVLIDAIDPDPLLVDIVDIAHSLSGEGRYTNHAKRQWTVGQHSLVVMEMCGQSYKYEALMHDASEAYIGDASAPLKKSEMMAAYRVIEDRLMTVIAKRYGFTWPEPPIVKHWDTLVRRVEQLKFMRGHKWPDREKATWLTDQWHESESRKIERFDATIREISKLIDEYASAKRSRIKRLFLEAFYDLRSERCFPSS